MTSQTSVTVEEDFHLKGSWCVIDMYPAGILYLFYFKIITGQGRIMGMGLRTKDHGMGIMGPGIMR